LILLIDNYDSFTYNLYQQVSGFGGDLLVVKNDELDLDQIQEISPEKIILSPGPKTPAESGVCIPVIKSFFKTTPILGICLGHQCIGVAFGQKVVPAKRLLFGKTSLVNQAHSRVMKSLPSQFDVARYHSLVLDAVPQNFRCTSQDAAGDIMSIEHDSYPLFGLQFHPESFLMESVGDRIIEKFLAL